MPVQTTEVRPGDPTVQASGQHRGTVKYTFTDAREFEVNLRTPDLTSWDAKLISYVAVIEEQVRKRDAEAAGQDPDEPLPDSDVGEASNLDILVGKLRTGYAIQDSTDSYRYTKQVNDWRVGKGFTWTQVRDAILADPSYDMTTEEFQDIFDRWTYLNTPAKITTMQDYSALVTGDTWSIG